MMVQPFCTKNREIQPIRSKSGTAGLPSCQLAEIRAVTADNCNGGQKEKKETASFITYIDIL
jgi:hypothetical protein